MPALAFPQSEATDPDSVADALDNGLLHWVKGEVVDALKCLRQASEAADDAGQDRRAVDLARAAAELAPHDSVAPTPPAAPSEAQPSEPRRSRLPEPPAPSRKYANATSADAASAAPAASPRTEASRGSLAPTPSAAKSATGATALATGRPSAPSGRPPANLTASASSAAHLGLHGAATPQQATAVARPSTTPQHKAEPAKPEPAKPEPAKPAGETTRPTTTRTAISATGHPTADAEVRPSLHSDALDHRLASLRVRIDRVESDGTVRVKLLDLAATASGEDNALLIVPQIVWQELKRNS